MSPSLAQLHSMPKIRIEKIPSEVGDYLQRHNREIIRVARGKCRGTFIEYSPKNRCLTIGGSPDMRQNAMMYIYDLLEKKGIRFYK